MDAAEQLRAQIDTEAGRLRQEIVTLEGQVDDLTRQHNRAIERWHTVVDQQGAARRRVQPVARHLDRAGRDLDRPTAQSHPDRRAGRWSATSAVGSEAALEPPRDVPGL